MKRKIKKNGKRGRKKITKKRNEQLNVYMLR